MKTKIGRLLPLPHHISPGREDQILALSEIPRLVNRSVIESFFFSVAVQDREEDTLINALESVEIAWRGTKNGNF